MDISSGSSHCSMASPLDPGVPLKFSGLAGRRGDAAGVGNGALAGAVDGAHLEALDGAIDAIHPVGRRRGVGAARQLPGSGGELRRPLRGGGVLLAVSAPDFPTLDRRVGGGGRRNRGEEHPIQRHVEGLVRRDVVDVGSGGLSSPGWWAAGVRVMVATLDAAPALGYV